MEHHTPQVFLVNRVILHPKHLAVSCSRASLITAIMSSNQSSQKAKEAEAAYLGTDDGSVTSLPRYTEQEPQGSGEGAASRFVSAELSLSIAS